MGIVKMWSITIYIIFLFYYTRGQIIQVPVDEQKVQLKLPNKDPPGLILPLKAKEAVRRQLPSQWEKESEVAYRWPNAQVRYYLDTNSYDTNIMSYLKIAFSIISEDQACPEFVKLEDKPRGDGGSWLHFTNPDRVRQCVHDPGLDVDGEIVVVFGYDCLKPAQILHTLLHGLGFRDEVTHPQRDLFVKVMWENIQPAFRSMFRIQSVTSGALLDYDAKSIMHFHDRAYSLNGQATIAPLLPGLRIEPSGGLSHLDKMKIRLTFGHECKKRQISKILRSCGRYNDFNNDNNGGGDDARIPGHDVKPENDTEQEVTPGNDESQINGDAVVIPGEDVDIESDPGNEVTPGNDESPSGGDEVVIPGEDVDIESDPGNEVTPGNDESRSGGDEVVIPGEDVNIESDPGNEVTPGNDKSQSNGDAVVAPGEDVDIESNPENDVTPGNDEPPSGGDEVLVPGEDVNIESDPENEVKSGNDESPSGGDEVVEPGEDVNIESNTQAYIKYDLPSGNNTYVVHEGGTLNISNAGVWGSRDGVSMYKKKTGRG